MCHVTIGPWDPMNLSRIHAVEPTILTPTYCGFISTLFRRSASRDLRGPPSTCRSCWVQRARHPQPIPGWDHVLGGLPLLVGLEPRPLLQECCPVRHLQVCEKREISHLSFLFSCKSFTAANEILGVSSSHRDDHAAR